MTATPRRTTSLAAASILLFALAACDSAPAPAPAPMGQVQETASTPAAKPTTTPAETQMNVYSLQMPSLEGKPEDLAQYRGKVTLVVNVASQCGYTPQYTGLQKLHAELKDQGFAVLGFPCNDFGAQEPGSATEIREFCTSKYAVDFPLFQKLQTKAGKGQSELYTMLESATGKLPTWNFCKYLVGKDGKVLQFFGANVAPDSKELRAAIATAMK
ncbi:MAG: glutathione peroxidase [Planctomycetota bacterium]